MSFLIAAPSSGSGKTTVTLGLLRALTQAGIAVRGAKSGPDYIDPRFHAAACGAECLNLDAWAMQPADLRRHAAGASPLIVEGAMGLFDGAPPDGRGSCADLALALDLPVILVVDCSHMAQSVAALVAGYVRHDPRLRIAGLILNRVGSDRHARLLQDALTPLGLPLLGTLRRDSTLALPSRHLGLVQAGEHPDLQAFLDRAAAAVTAQVDLDRIATLLAARPETPVAATGQPPAQRIAIASDAAFAFAYPHLLRDWQAAGATLHLFSPLADDAVPQADLVYLPGGYPELHAGALSRARVFMSSLRNAAQTSDIYGECGGYMVLGDALTDAEGQRHEMAGLLRLETSFASRKLHLGYRHLSARHGPFAGRWRGHEFHYATVLSASGDALFTASDAEGTRLPDMGLRAGRVCGSFAHLIAPDLAGADDAP